MVEYRYTWLLFGILIWPVIVNAQAGTTFLFLGIDWKADNLDGTLFWIGILFLVLFLVALTLGEKLNKKEKK